VETDRIIAFRSHWGYQSEYCNPASGNEKGGVEGELGWFRRNLLVPVPEASDLAALNQRVLADCVANRGRTIIGKSMTIGAASELEREHLSPLAAEGFPIHELLYPLIVDSKGRVKVKTNWYSTSLWPGLRVTAVVGPLAVEIMHDNKVAVRALRARQRTADQQSSILQVGGHLQGPDDHGGSDRPAGAPLGHRRAEHPQLSSPLNAGWPPPAKR
jgi:hypothetical protein